MFIHNHTTRENQEKHFRLIGSAFSFVITIIHKFSIKPVYEGVVTAAWSNKFITAEVVVPMYVGVVTHQYECYTQGADVVVPVYEGVVTAERRNPLCKRFCKHKSANLER